MQETLPHKALDFYGFYCCKNKKKNKTIKTIVVLIITICILIISTLIYYKNNDKNSYYQKQYYYLISLYNTDNERELERLKEKVSEVGGAGYAYESGKQKEVIAFAYLDSNSASSIEVRLKEKYPQVKVIEIKCEELNKTAKQELKKDELLDNAFKKICDTSKKIYNLAIEFDKNKDVSKAYRSLTRTYLELESVKEEISGKKREYLPEKVSQSLQISVNVKMLLINSVQSQIYKGDISSSDLKSIFVQSCLEDQALRRALNAL